MNDLIARLESATGPSLELDGRIWCAVNGYRFAHWDGAGCAYYFDDGKVSGIRHAPASRIRPFSASLDAALTLVPDDAWLNMGHRRELGSARMCHCGFEVSGPPYYHGGHAATFPLAACIAALRARQHQSKAA